MTDPHSDPMWPHFRPLWTDLCRAGGALQLAGGYGLFLKQRWALRAAEPTVIPLADWRDAAPRVTNDLDIVLGLDIISDKARQKAVSDALRAHDFVEKKPRLVFVKTVGVTEIVVDLHTPPPPDDTYPNVSSDACRVKHNPSLAADGVHGIPNVEADGHHLHPRRFETDGVAIEVPNPVTWCVMKLTAMHDRLGRAARPSTDPDLQEL